MSVARLAAAVSIRPATGADGAVKTWSLPPIAAVLLAWLVVGPVLMALALPATSVSTDTRASAVKRAVNVPSS